MMEYKSRLLNNCYSTPEDIEFFREGGVRPV
jgi:hypothetical protein